MTFPTVIELPRRLEPLSRDTFAEPATRAGAATLAAPAVRRIVD